MPVNADKPHLWKADIAESVDSFNRWFMRFAPAAFRRSRTKSTAQVVRALQLTGALKNLTPDTLVRHPGILPFLRMATAPPIARDRLVGLAGTGKTLVYGLEEGRLPKRVSAPALNASLGRICDVIDQLLDRDLFPWIGRRGQPTKTERYRAATVVADRLCGTLSDPIVRNAQEARQLRRIEEYLVARGYSKTPQAACASLAGFRPGTFCFRFNVVVGQTRSVKIPIDAVVQPRSHTSGSLPILIEAKSAGDFTNTNKRRKEEATKFHQLKDKFGPSIRFILFLNGYFDSGYLGYEAAEGLDWVWEHRMDDLLQLGI